MQLMFHGSAKKIGFKNSPLTNITCNWQGN